MLPPLHLYPNQHLNSPLLRRSLNTRKKKLVEQPPRVSPWSLVDCSGQPNRCRWEQNTSSDSDDPLYEEKQTFKRQHAAICITWRQSNQCGMLRRSHVVLVGRSGRHVGVALFPKWCYFSFLDVFLAVCHQIKNGTFAVAKAEQKWPTCGGTRSSSVQYG